MTGGGDTPSPTPDISSTVAVNDYIDGFEDEVARIGTIRIGNDEKVPVWIKEGSSDTNSSIYIPGSYAATGSLVPLAASPAYSETPTIQHVLDSIAAAAGCEVYIVDRAADVKSSDVFSLMPDYYRGAYRFLWDGQPGHNCMCTVGRDGSAKFLMPTSDNSKRFYYSNSAWAVSSNNATPSVSVETTITDNANFSFAYHGFSYSITAGASNLDIPAISGEV